MKNDDQSNQMYREPMRSIHVPKKRVHFCRCIWAWMIISGILIAGFDIVCLMLSISDPSWVSDYYIIMWAKYGTGIIPCATLIGFIIWHL